MLIHEFIAINRKKIPRNLISKYKALKQKYEVILFSDDIVLKYSDLLLTTQDLKTYWNDFSNPEMGLNYYGDTIVPRESLSDFIAILKEIEEKENSTFELVKLCEEALYNKKDIVHFGI